MKYKLLILILFLFSCTTSNQKSIKYKKSFTPYSSKGFALIYTEEDYKNKIVSKKMDSTKMQVAHNKLGTNKILVLANPENKKSIELKISKRAKYPSFFNVLITQNIADELNLNPEFPFLEVYQRVKNKSFVAKKAVIFNEEKKVIDRAPITKIKIDNISQNKISKPSKIKTKKSFSILIGEFYSKKSAQNLRNILSDKYIKKEHLIVKNLGKNRFELLAGPYLSINTLKNDYFELNKYGFEDLDIKQND